MTSEETQAKLSTPSLINGNSESCEDEQIKHNKPKSNEPKKAKRRVRFPDGEVISDYLEPFRPVPDNCTSEELIAAYLESCFQYKVAPIEFLLEQLKGIDLSICNERYSRLSLKGIRLNRLQVETLEEIFRRVHFRELDFEGTYLDDQSAVAFFDMLLHYETCNELNVTMNLDRMHPSQGWARCVAFLRRSSELRRFTLTHTPLNVSNFLTLSFYGLCVERLSLRDCNLSGQALFGLVRWLRLLLSSASLDPPGRDKNGDAKSTRRARFAKTKRFLHKQPSIWELKLDLAYNKLNVTDAETLLMLIRHHLLVPQVEQVCAPSSEAPSIPTVESGDDQDPVSTGLLPVGGIGFLADLDVSNNNLGDDGLRVICTGLLQCYRNRLRQIHSDQNTVTGQEAMEDTTLTTTPVKINPTSEEVSLRVRGLERLCLANNGLTSSGMQIVALMLMHTPLRLVSLVGGLISLDLSNNPGIRDEGIEILCEGLIRNHSLKELYLRAVRMSFSGIFALSGFLSESKTLRMLDIRSNQLDLASLMALSKTLALNYTLTGFLSDARSLASQDNPLLATDAELISFLLNEIDSYLRRNRAALEDNTRPAAYTINATRTSFDTSVSGFTSHIEPTEPQDFEHQVSSASCDSCPTEETSTMTVLDTDQPCEDGDPTEIEKVEQDFATPLTEYFTEYTELERSAMVNKFEHEDQWTFVNKRVDDHPGAPMQFRKELPPDNEYCFYGQANESRTPRGEVTPVVNQNSPGSSCDFVTPLPDSSHLSGDLLPVSKQNEGTLTNSAAYKSFNGDASVEHSPSSSSGQNETVLDRDGSPPDSFELQQ